MRRTILLACMILVACIALAQDKTVPQVTAPVPTVPERFTILGQYVRVAYNNEGFATLGYGTAQQSVGQDWVLLNVGITVMDKVPNFTLKREHLSLKTPDGTIVPLPPQKEFMEAGYLTHLVRRDNKIHDSIDYFPNDVTRACALRFFGQPGVIAFDEVELSSDRGCVGRLFFKVPGKIVPGQYWLIVQFAKSSVEVPFRILTEAEAKEFQKTWQDIKKAHEGTLK